MSKTKEQLTKNIFYYFKSWYEVIHNKAEVNDWVYQQRAEDLATVAECHAKKYAEKQSIDFHNWSIDNYYMSIIRNKERMFFQPMQSPLHTHAELYQLFLNDQNK
jgi:hypothetical protein